MKRTHMSDQRMMNYEPSIRSEELRIACPERSRGADCGLRIATHRGIPKPTDCVGGIRPKVLLTLVALLILPVCSALAQDARPTLDLQGNVLTTARQVITIAPTGLPEQIDIPALPSELPLELRAEGAEVTDALLAEIGRGTQLRGPIRIEATVGGKVFTAEPTAPAAPAVKDGAAVCTSKLTAGSVRIDLTTRYGPYGELDVEMACQAGTAVVDELALVVEPSGRVDLVVPGLPVQDKLQAYDSAEFALPGDEGVVWGNAPADAKEGQRTIEGVVPRCFLGSGDRGFTWFTDPKGNWHIDPKASMMTVTRDKAGQATWRVRFVNGPVKLDSPQKVTFRLQTHPAVQRPGDARGKMWMEWPATGLAPIGPADPDAALRKVRVTTAGQVTRADSAILSEGVVAGAELRGPVGGAGLSAQQDLADTFPMPLFRYLAGTHTGLPARLVPNAAELIAPGMNPGPDRVALGRALLHDIGCDATGIAHRTDALRVVKALNDFGYFADDGKTEFLPWWRSKRYVRYGEAFAADDAFALHTADPMGRVHVSVYRRSVPKGQGVETLIIILNETDAPVREQLYVLDPARVFGGENIVNERQVVGAYDYSHAPPESDWGKGPMTGRMASDARQPIVLHDRMDDGYVRRSAARDGVEVYGPVHIPAHDFRILYGRSK